LETNEKEQIRIQAIEAEEQRLERIYSFLETHPLDTDVNITVALELATSIEFIKKNIEKLKDLGNTSTQESSGDAK
jgi:hypothetical protein